MKLIKMIGMLAVLSLIIVLSILFANRVIYGTFNVFGYPNRVFFDGYRYDNNGYIVTLNGNKRPKYKVSGLIDRITGKEIYSIEKDFIGNGKVVYLHLDGDKYLVLGSGGGG
jgi:hypothetical protein